MDDDNETPEKETVEPARDAGEEEGAKLRKVSEEELKQILEAHKTWLETEEEEGEQADLFRTDLQGAELGHANLQRADLAFANLQGAKLNGADLQRAILTDANLQGAFLNGSELQGADLSLANLQGAYLRGADLQGAHLVLANLQGANLDGTNLQGAILNSAKLQGATLYSAYLRGADLARANFEGEAYSSLAGADLGHADLCDADLSDAKLSDVTGLLADELAGANLSNAKLPEDIAKFEGLAQVAEISRHARNNFLAVLGACVFSWLTIATTTDVALLTNRAETALPVIGTEVPIAGFYWAAPPILLALFLYLHLYLQRMWTGLASLPAVFPDGHTLDRRAYPWLLTSLVNAHVPLLRKERPPFSRLMVCLSIVAAWLLVPATLGLFWLRYLPRHDWIWTIEQLLLFAISIAFAAAFYWRARATLIGHEAPPFAWQQAWQRTATYAYGGLFLFFAAAGFGVSLGAIDGLPWWVDDRPGQTHRKIVPQVLGFFGYSPFFDLVDAEISVKPDNWTGLGDELTAQIAQVKPARLSNMDLRYLYAPGAFLVKADLPDADLQEANLSGANLQKAFLPLANLQGADLRAANLREADLRGADLRGANLTEAMGLTRAQLDEACGDDETKLPDDLADYQMKPCPEPEQSPAD